MEVGERQSIFLQFNFGWNSQDILLARDRYRGNTAEMHREGLAFASGQKIAAGEISLGSLDAIIKWKSSRPLGMIRTDNTSEEIIEALHVTVRAEQARTAMGVLCGLRGVAVPMASAILTAIYPDHYTIIDWRTLKALGIRKSSLSIDNYLQYLKFCKAMAAELEIPLRDLDQALWMLGGT